MQSTEIDIDGDIIDLADFSEFDNHDSFFYVSDAKTGLRAFIAIHRKNGKVPSFGATRMWSYENDKEAIVDVLRLSKLMSYKSALAGLECGGAKAVILADTRREGERALLLESYAKKVNVLEGSFVTGTDVGLNQTDIIQMQKGSPYFVGARVNPTIYTAYGVLQATKASLNEVFGSPDTQNRSFAIQGVGKIGAQFLDLIYKEAKEIYIADINNESLKKVKERYPKVEIVPTDKIHSLGVDVFSPCALSSAVNSKTINEIQAKVIVGGANNQLESEEIGKQLFKKGILYSPDFVVNAGGLISVVNEYYYKGTHPQELMEKVSHIESEIKKIISESKKRNISTNEVAIEFAKKITNKYIS